MNSKTASIGVLFKMGVNGWRDEDIYGFKSFGKEQ